MLKLNATDLPFLCLVASILWKEVREDVTTATSHMYKRALFAQTQTCRHSQHHPHRLDEQRPFSQVASNDEPTQYSFDLGKCERQNGELTRSFPVLSQSVLSYLTFIQ